MALWTLCAVVVASMGAPAIAGKKKKRVERTAEGAYVAVAVPRGVTDTPCPADQVGCVILPVEKGERFVEVEIIDASGQDVWASVYIYGYSDGTDGHEHICGKSDGPLQLGPGVTELVVIVTQTTGGATNPCAGAASQGTVSATFSNLP